MLFRSIVKCVREWHSELCSLSQPFKILTDHKNLKPFMVKKQLNEQQIHWSEFLAPLNFRLAWCAGREAIVPNALSRREQNTPLDRNNTHMTEREKTLLPPYLWVHAITLDMPCPFTDDQDITDLWGKAINHIGQVHLESWTAVKQGERQFLCKVPFSYWRMQGAKWILTIPQLPMAVLL